MNVAEKLLKVQTELNAPKNQYNSFGKYKYRSCEDILEGLKPILKEVNAIVLVGDSLEHIGDRYYIKATAQFIDCASGEIKINTAYAREEESKKGMDASQVTGSTSSYARKYALNGLFCIDDVKDSDSTNKGDGDKATNKPTNSKPANKNEPTNQEQQANENIKIDQAKLNTIKGELERTGVKESVIFNSCKIKKLEDMTVKNFMDMMKKFKVTPDKKVEE
ncbi:MAG: ERF family protein [Lachnotalea sp.]